MKCLFLLFRSTLVGSSLWLSVRGFVCVEDSFMGPEGGIVIGVHLSMFDCLSRCLLATTTKTRGNENIRGHYSAPQRNFGSLANSQFLYIHHLLSWVMMMIVMMLINILKPLYLIFFILMPHQFLYKPYLLQPHHASTLFLKCAKVYHFGVCGH